MLDHTILGKGRPFVAAKFPLRVVKSGTPNQADHQFCPNLLYSLDIKYVQSGKITEISVANAFAEKNDMRGVQIFY